MTKLIFYKLIDKSELKNNEPSFTFTLEDDGSFNTTYTASGLCKESKYDEVVERCKDIALYKDFEVTNRFNITTITTHTTFFKPSTGQIVNRKNVSYYHVEVKEA